MAARGHGACGKGEPVRHPRTGQAEQEDQRGDRAGHPETKADLARLPAEPVPGPERECALDGGKGDADREGQQHQSADHRVANGEAEHHPAARLRADIVAAFAAFLDHQRDADGRTGGQT